MAHNILVRMPNWIGDLVMATPVLTDLRTAFPDASITAMCPTPLNELLEEDSSIDELFCFTKPSNQFLRREERRDIIAKIKTGKYNLGILLTHSFSSAWWFWQGKVQRRLGYATHCRSFLLTDPVPLPKTPMHQVEYYKKILQPLAISPSNTPPRLFVSTQEVQRAQKLLETLGYVRGKPLIGINPGAAYGSAKCWPPERFRALAQQLLKEEVYLIFFGDASHVDLLKQICQGLSERVMNVAGATSLRELVCLIQCLDILVTNDSGPMHIGAALGIPLIALFGSTDETRTGPFGQKEAIIHKHVRCAPCFKRICPIDFQCMMQITVKEVAEKVHQQLQIRRSRV